MKDAGWVQAAVVRRLGAQFEGAEVREATESEIEAAGMKRLRSTNYTSTFFVATTKAGTRAVVRGAEERPSYDFDRASQRALGAVPIAGQLMNVGFAARDIGRAVMSMMAGDKRDALDYADAARREFLGGAVPAAAFVGAALTLGPLGVAGVFAADLLLRVGVHAYDEGISEELREGAVVEIKEVTKQ